MKHVKQGDMLGKTQRTPFEKSHKGLIFTGLDWHLKEFGHASIGKWKAVGDLKLGPSMV